MAIVVRSATSALAARHTAPSDATLPPSWRLAMRTFCQDDRGQDVIEYGLLAAFFGIVTIATWAAIVGTLTQMYNGYNTDVQNLWESPNPGGGS